MMFNQRQFLIPEILRWDHMGSFKEKCQRLQKTRTSLLFLTGTPDRFLGCITSGKQLLNE